jgi:predicted nucleic acid-binding Zn finger protein
MSDLCSEDVVRYFENYDKVIEALASKRFIVLECKGLVTYIFKGTKRDYIVSPCRLCTCEDFIINYIGKNRSTPCYHVVGFRIAEKHGKLTKLDVDNKTLSKILEEIVLDGISYTLRKLLKSS